MSHESYDRPAASHGSSNRLFGFVFAAFFLVVASLPLVRGHPFRWWALVVSVVFLALTLVVPAVLTPLNRAWTRFGMLLNRITNPIVLGLMFFLVITPVGIILKLLGKDLLRLKKDSNASSYWIVRNPPGPPPASLTQQF